MRQFLVGWPGLRFRRGKAAEDAFDRVESAYRNWEAAGSPVDEHGNPPAVEDWADNQSS